jgi:hypothetical protein
MNSSFDYNYELNKWIKSMDLALMVTVKYYTTANEHECIRSFNKLMSNVNKKIYKRNYNKRNNYIDGFVSFELNKGKTVSKFHNHVLIKNGNWYGRFNIYEMMDIFIKSSNKIYNISGVPVFLPSKSEVKRFRNYEVTELKSPEVTGLYSGCYHIIETYNDNAVNYITKEVSREFSNFKMLGVNGLSDNCTDFLKIKTKYY